MNLRRTTVRALGTLTAAAALCLAGTGIAQAATWYDTHRTSLTWVGCQSDYYALNAVYSRAGVHIQDYQCREYPDPGGAVYWYHLWMLV
ncbi:hypothetical protein ACIA8R_08920 [Nonomuraea sp. NPDC051191]|uniref:hypothetical protein n=1 Tax=Nonomuraea sp. NPDC051191 TaxID=3364372 RepID=UPI00378C98F7